MAASPKRICEQCGTEAVPEAHHWYFVEGLTVIEFDGVVIPEGADMCSIKCALARIEFALYQSRNRAREYSPERLERMVK